MNSNRSRALAIFILLTNSVSAFALSNENLSLCLKRSTHAQCFMLKESKWVQRAGNGVASQTGIDKKQQARLRTEIANFKSWAKSELMKRPSKNSDCHLSAEFDLNSKTEVLCFDSIQGKKLDSKLAAVTKSLSLRK